METKKYHISDELQKLIDWENIMTMPRYAGGHDDQMKGLFKGSKVIAHYNEGDYQGTVATCVKLSDGRFVIYNDYYGSCSGCDSWEDASDEEVKSMCINLSNGAYIFNSLTDVKEYLESVIENTTESFDWAYCSKHLLDCINCFCFSCSLQRMGFYYSGESHTYELNHNKEIKIVIEHNFVKLGFTNEEYKLKFPVMDMSKQISDNEVVLYIMPYIGTLIDGYIENTFIDNCNNAFKDALKKKLDER